MTQARSLYTARGVTLIELAMVLVIIGLLAALAFPSYKKSVRATQRSAAQAQLMDCSQKIERFYAGSMSYSGARISNAGGTGTCSLTATGLAQSGGQIYSVDFSAPPTATSYVLLATPSVDQSSDICKTLCIDNSGVKISGVVTGRADSASCSALIAAPISGC